MNTGIIKPTHYMFKDIAGQVIGKYKPIKVIGKNTAGAYVWECKCQECGSTREFTYNQLDKMKDRDHCTCERYYAGRGKKYKGTTIKAIVSATAPTQPNTESSNVDKIFDTFSNLLDKMPQLDMDITSFMEGLSRLVDKALEPGAKGEKEALLLQNANLKDEITTKDKLLSDVKESVQGLLTAVERYADLSSSDKLRQLGEFVNSMKVEVQKVSNLYE